MNQTANTTWLDTLSQLGSAVANAATSYYDAQAKVAAANQRTAAIKAAGQATTQSINWFVPALFVAGAVILFKMVK